MNLPDRFVDIAKSSIISSYPEDLKQKISSIIDLFSNSENRPGFSQVKNIQSEYPGEPISSYLSGLLLDESGQGPGELEAAYKNAIEKVTDPYGKSFFLSEYASFVRPIYQDCMRASALYRHALELNALNHSASLGLAGCLSVLGEYDEALRLYRELEQNRSLSVREQLVVNHAIGRLLLAEYTQVADARTALEKNVELFKGGRADLYADFPLAESFDILYQICFSESDFTGVVFYARIVLAKYPDNFSALYYGGLSLFECNDYAGAKSLLTSFLKEYGATTHGSAEVTRVLEIIENSSGSSGVQQ